MAGGGSSSDDEAPFRGRPSASMRESKRLEQAAIEAMSPRERMLKALALGRRARRVAREANGPDER